MTVAWVTGGGTGIGRALAEALYRQGARVVITGRRKDVLEQTAQEIASGPPHGGEILAIAGNASESSHALHVIEDVKKRWGPINLLINNAGSNANRSLLKAPAEEYQDAFENNVMSAIRAAQAVLPGMRSARRGAIINISSVYGRIASSNSASYTVSKHALAGYTDALRQAVAGSGIHVMGVYPGYIQTAMTQPFVRRGSIRSFVGKSPDQMAAAILRAWRKKRRDLYYPWYVPWVLRLSNGMPGLTDWLLAKTKQ